MLAEERDAVAVFGEIHGVADLHRAAGDARRQALAPVERHNHQLIRSIRDKLLRSSVDQGFSVDDSRAGIGHTAPRMVTTAVAPEPPRFCAKPKEWRSI